jgi:hypothetical protein
MAASDGLTLDDRMRNTKSSSSKRLNYIFRFQTQQISTPPKSGVLHSLHLLAPARLRARTIFSP